MTRTFIPKIGQNFCGPEWAMKLKDAGFPQDRSVMYIYIGNPEEDPENHDYVGMLISMDRGNPDWRSAKMRGALAAPSFEEILRVVMEKTGRSLTVLFDDFNLWLTDTHGSSDRPEDFLSDAAACWFCAGHPVEQVEEKADEIPPEIPVVDLQNPALDAAEDALTPDITPQS